MEHNMNWAEVKEEEIDYEDVPNEFSELNETNSNEIQSPPSETVKPKPSRKRKRKSDFRVALDGSIKKGELDLLAAGTAIQKAYETNQSGIPNEINSFVTQNLMSVPFPRMPDSFQMNSQMVAMMHGYGLAAQMAFMASNNTTKAYRATALPKDIFNCVSDYPDHVKSKFNYPSTAPFSGEPIRIDSIPMLDASIPAHVRLQNYLFQLLGKACTNPTDIQRFWNIPGEKNHRYGTPSIFPKELFDNLKQLFLEFFQLDFEELDNLSYSENFSEMEILKRFTVQESKKQTFEDFAAAKKVFKAPIFLLEFKAALKELRHGNFISYEDVPGGYFVKRQRHIPKKDINNGNELVEAKFEVEQ